MVSIPKVVGVMSCGYVLGLGLYLNGSHTITGEVVRVEPSAYFVKQYDGYKCAWLTQESLPYQFFKPELF
jgi:hypothetical protein